jgi:hypothetical protein
MCANDFGESFAVEREIAGSARRTGEKVADTPCRKERLAYACRHAAAVGENVNEAERRLLS